MDDDQPAYTLGEQCRHDSQEGIRAGGLTGWLCMECERVVEWNDVDVDDGPQEKR